MIGGDLAARFSDFASVAVAKFSLDVLISKAIAAKLSLNCDFSRLVIQLLNIAEAPLRIRFLRRHRSGLTRSLYTLLNNELKCLKNLQPRSLPVNVNILKYAFLHLSRIANWAKLCSMHQHTSVGKPALIHQ